MTQLILSTGNVMSGGPSIFMRKNGNSRSNLELVNSLRDNFAVAQQDYAEPTAAATQGTNGNSTHAHARRTPATAWTERTDDQHLYIPRIDWQAAGLRDEINQYEVTVKLFLLPGTVLQERERHVEAALDLVRRELGIQTIELLVVSFPGMSFEGTCEWEADKINAQQGNLDDEIETWKVFEALHSRGLVRRLGVAEFGSEKLRDFVQRTSVAPSVDQINLKDCCNVPPPLKKFADEAGIELNVHTDCTDILPVGTLRELLGHGPKGAGVLADPANNAAGLEGELTPQWVARYVAFIRDRGVIENKGYFAGAWLHDQ